MIQTKNFAVKDIPQTWIFEYYCKLEEKLHGQDIKILSIFKTEKTPSMCIYIKDDTYMFKDFSTGYSGNGIELVKKLQDINYYKASAKICFDYRNRSKDTEYTPAKFKVESKFKITSHTKRSWNVYDQKYWNQFKIGSKILEYYNVFPLEEYKMSKSIDNQLFDINAKGQHIYGYFKASGSLAKIYRPKNKSLKFINVSPFIQGSDQLTYSKSTLIICSSLKDAMSLHELGFNHIEMIAPNSENSMISNANLAAYSFKYDTIMTLFDNDIAGHNAMEKYQNEYGIQGIHLNLSKDISDSVRDHGQKMTKQCLQSLIL